MWTLGIHIMICSDIRSTVISFVDQICKPGRVRTMTLFASARFASHLVIVVVWVNLKSAYQNTSRVTWSANLVPHVPSTMKSLEVGLQGSVTPSWHQYSVLTDCMLSHWTFTFCREIRCPSCMRLILHSVLAMKMGQGKQRATPSAWNVPRLKVMTPKGCWVTNMKIPTSDAFISWSEREKTCLYHSHLSAVQLRKWICPN